MSRPFGRVDLRTWYHVEPDEAALVVVVSTRRGTLINKRDGHRRSVYQREHTPDASNFVMSCYRMHRDAALRAHQKAT